MTDVRRMVSGRRSLALIIGIALDAAASIAMSRLSRQRNSHDNPATAMPEPATAPPRRPIDTPESEVSPAPLSRPRRRRLNSRFGSRSTAAFTSTLMLLIVGYQTWLMIRQTEIVEKQDKLLARRAVINVRAEKVKAEGDNITYVIVAANVGQRAARGYYWTLLAPQLGGPVVGFQFDVSEPGEPVQTNGATFIPHNGYVEPPLFPGRRQKLATFSIRRSAPNEKIAVRFLWQIAAEDGIFPKSILHADASSGNFGVLIIDGR